MCPLLVEDSHFACVEHALCLLLAHHVVSVHTCTHTHTLIHQRRTRIFLHTLLIREIISMPRADSDYHHDFMVNSWVFKDDESESEAKTNSGPRMCPLLVESPHFACLEHAQCSLLAHHVVSVHTCTHTHTLIHQRRTQIFLHTLLLRADHQYLNDQHLTCEVLPRMYVILTRSGFLFTYKMVQEIISMPRADSGYPHNFIVNSWVFKDDESESEGKTNSGSQICPLLVEGQHFACVEHAQCLLLAHRVSTCAHTHTTSPPKADPNFLTQFTAKGGPLIFKWSTLSM